MTLKDFFTLTEMKDGLTALARVKELVTVMQKERDSVLKNAGDTTQQWSTVARTIVATENKDCLDLFIQLDGLWFIDRWLNDAQKFSNDTGDSLLEESITELLRALEKLHIDNQKLVSSGMWMTVKNLLGHNSSRVQDRAKALFDSWKQDRDGGAIPQDIEEVEAFCDDGLKVRPNHVGDNKRPEGSSHDISPSTGSHNEEKNVEPARDEMMPSICCDALQPESVNAQIQTSEKTLDPAVVKDGPQDPTFSDSLKLVNGNLPIKEDSPIHRLEGTAVMGNCGSAVPKQGTLEGQLDFDELNQYTDDVKQIQKISSSEKVGEMDTSSVPSPLEQRAQSSSADVTNSSEHTIEPDSKEDIDTSDKDPCPVSTFTDVMQESFGNNCKLGESEDPNTSFSRIEDFGVVDEAREHASDEDEDDSGNDSAFSKAAVDAKNRDVVDNIEVDYGIVDPLEVARQVAIEVEREVDCRDPSCSSSEEIPGGGIRRPDSPDSTNGKQNLAIDGLPKEVPDRPDSTNEPFVNAKSLGAEQENCVHDMESSPFTEAAQEPKANTEKGFCDFDLNQEICSEDMDHPVNPVYLDFDLNVAEVGDDKIADLMAKEQIPSGESSVEASPRKSERLQLDLNIDSDQNGFHSPPRSSSSSSMQPFLRNIDLNDQPSYLNDSSSHPYFVKSSQSLNVSKGDETVISIMGARVVVIPKNFVPQTPPLANLRILEPAMDVNLGRIGGVLEMGSAALPYAHSPVNGYNGFTPGPNGPFSSAVYGAGGPMPYIVDSRGAAVVPQLMGSSIAFPPAFSQPPFITTLNGASLVSNGAGPLRHNFDLNSGSMIEEGNRDDTMRQIFNPGLSRSIDDNLRAVGGKRKEPESGWELYPFNYKHHHQQP